MAVQVYDPETKQYVEIAPGQAEDDEAARIRQGIPGATASARLASMPRAAPRPAAASQGVTQPSAVTAAPAPPPTLPRHEGQARSMASMLSELGRAGIAPVGRGA